MSPPEFATVKRREGVVLQIEARNPALVLIMEHFIDLNAQKIVVLHNGIVTVAAGESIWSDHIIERLEERIINGENLTPSMCSEFTNFFLNNPNGFNRGPGLPDDFNINDIEKCDILFAGFVPDPCNDEGSRPSLFFGNKHDSIEIVDANRDIADLPEGEFVTTFAAVGTGDDFAEHVLGQNVDSLADGRLMRDVHARKILKAMRAAFLADPENTGGFVNMAHVTRRGLGGMIRFGPDLGEEIRRLKRAENRMRRIHENRMRRLRMLCKLNRFRYAR
ncbi:uncharacterized protein LOC113353018 isoform X2 [Papaver somniferum]|uniref:uncharacterized protein LOC113353018 isoform X2 n=2 Tax=Papaver somniferum TaxID=3469 RepID=UPI000E6FE8C3|nr:uncharacterized protein LOC113353018 isoform X2 [Papaver somniferum]